jgi:DNA-binding IclR family transcriptional regulator
MLAAATVGDEIVIELARQLEEQHGVVTDLSQVDGGLVGYLCHVARRDPRSFTSLLGRVLPLVVQGGEKPITVEMVERAEKFTKALQQLADRADNARPVN